MAEETITADAIELATELTIAWLSNPNTRVQVSEIPEFLRAMYDAVNALTSPADTAVTEEPAQQATEPAVTVRKSLASPEHILSLIDGKAYKLLKRHLSRHGLTPQEYRAKFGLKADYPMVAPAYAVKRRALANSIGLGQKRSKDTASAPSAKPARKARTKAAPNEAS